MEDLNEPKNKALTNKFVAEGMLYPTQREATTRRKKWSERPKNESIVSNKQKYWSKNTKSLKSNQSIILRVL